MSLYIGLMSGTSLDGVDALLADFDAPTGLAVKGHVHHPMPADLGAELLALNRAGPDELHRAALAGQGLAALYADAVDDLLRRCGVPAAQVRALGAHGQTVRHRPELGYTVQLLDGARLAERCNIDVICDFRSRDVAARGQGAPLVPAFHAALFHRPGVDLAVLNLGGIANLTLLHGDGRIGGFDCGPGNMLLDLWARRHLDCDFDDGGAWGATGQVDARLLERLLAERFFALAPPKSTGRELFDAQWLEARLDTRPEGAASPADMQATLAELSARAAAEALRRHLPAVTRLLLCGGGALNLDLVQRLRTLLPGVALATTMDAGLPPLQVEAAAFAWLAREFLARRPGNRPAVTGAAGPRILGALYPAH